MTTPMTPDEGSEGQGVKQNFIGRVAFSRVDCDCETCQEGNQGLIDYLMDQEGLSEEEAREQATQDVDHFAQITPLDDTYDKDMSVLSMNIPQTGSWSSRWMVMMGFLHNIYGDLKETLRSAGIVDAGEDPTAEDICEFIEGRVYEFRDIGWTEDEEHPMPGANMTLKEIGENSTSDMNTMLVPVREVTGEELEALGEPQDTGEVDEIDMG